MSIPLDRLYHYIENIAKEIRGDDVIIYLFYPHGSKKLENLSRLNNNIDWKNGRTLPQIYCYDQEPLNFDLYKNIPSLINNEKLSQILIDNHPDLAFNNLRYDFVNIFDQAILLHSEKQSAEVVKYQQSNFIPVYYWSHAVIALDWFRYAQHQTQIKNVKKTFLIYNRAWSGTREYRLKFIDLLIDQNLISTCQTSCNSIEPELQVHYSKYQYIDQQWKPENQLENYTSPTPAASCSSADFSIEDYCDTEFEVVLETLFDDARIQLTEKILRPIACGQPFLLLGTAGSLKYLQHYGFKTFSDIIDESYDNINNAKDRMQAVINTMTRIVNWTDSERKINHNKIKEITEHNRSHFFSKEFFDFVITEFKENLNQGLAELENTNTSNRFLNTRKYLFPHDTADFYSTNDTPLRSREDLLYVIKKAKSYQMRHQ